MFRPIFLEIHNIRFTQNPFLGAFTKLRKASISFVTCHSVCPFFRIEELGSYWTDFHSIWFLAKFYYSWIKITGSLPKFHFTSRSVHLRIKMFQAKVVEKNETHILCSITLFRNSCRLWDNVEKCCRAGQATDDNMAHAHCMLDIYG
jgi:hypothetical protein